MSLVEILGFLTGAVNVWLLARQNIWNWPIGLANNALYVAVFLSAGLYGDAGLQLVYITLGIYGWWTWSHPGVRVELQVIRTPRSTWIWLIPATAAAAIGLAFFLRRFTDSTVTVWDGFTTALSLAAIYGQTKKYLESWWIWITVDIVYVPLYIYKHLRLTSALYFVFFLLCVMGLREWSRALPTQRERIQKITRQIREILMRDWDPIEVQNAPEAADEYDMYIGRIYGLIARGASVDEIEKHLRAIEMERIELVIPDSQRAQVANSLKDLAQSMGAR